MTLTRCNPCKLAKDEYEYVQINPRASSDEQNPDECSEMR